VLVSLVAGGEGTRRSNLLCLCVGKLLSLFDKLASSVLLLSALTVQSTWNKTAKRIQTSPGLSAQSDSDGLKRTTDELDMPLWISYW
jgi:hypothetical protein